MVYIYALIDPRDKEVRYIGKARNADLRKKQHLREKAATPKAEWLKELACLGFAPDMVILEEVGDHQWQDAEQRWIKEGFEDGWRLTNSKPGGEGHSLRDRMDRFLKESAGIFGVSPGELNEMLSLEDAEKIEAIVANAMVCAEKLRDYYKVESAEDFFGLM